MFWTAIAMWILSGILIIGFIINKVTAQIKSDITCFLHLNQWRDDIFDKKDIEKDGEKI